MVGFLVTSSFPFIAVAGFWLAYRANSRHRRGQVIVFGAITVVALICTALWTMITCGE